MLETHDRQQLEFRRAFALEEQGPGELAVDTFVFVPNNVGLNSANYKKEDFFGDSTALMRLDAPPQSLTALVDPNSGSSPLAPLWAAVDALRSGKTVPSLSLATHVKLFAYIQTLDVKRELAELEETIPNRPNEEWLKSLEECLDRIRKSLEVYRKTRRSLLPFEPLCHVSLSATLASADEYMSIYLEEQLAEFARSLDEHGPRRGSCFVPRVSGMIRRLAADEADYRRLHGFLVYARDREDESEHFTYRRSLLKKSIHQALYLDARKVKSPDAFIKNTVGMFGAALAATWAWATRAPEAVAGLPTDVKLLVFCAAVLAYVAKDRIKALINDHVVPLLRRFDKHSTIRGAALEEVGLGSLSAELLERVRFEPFSKIPENIRAIRLARRPGRFVGEAQNENVIHYRKVLRVKSVDVASLPRGYGVLDIFRLNIRHFLSRLDDPKESMSYFDVDRRQFGRSKLPKTYHVNVVIRAQVEGRAPEHEHFRVVLDKRGILRTESVD